MRDCGFTEGNSRVYRSASVRNVVAYKFRTLTEATGMKNRLNVTSPEAGERPTLLPRNYLSVTPQLVQIRESMYGGDML